MKTVGQLLKESRLKQNLSVENLAKATKIRQDYLEAIEKNQFHTLPSAAFVKGFIQTYARAVDLDPQTALAVFRRDFDQNKQGRIIPRGLADPLQTPSKVWTPRTTTIVLGIILTIFVAGYSIRQIINLNAAPEINITSPETEILTNPIVEVSGSTSSDATITVNSQPISTDLNGNFKTSLNLSPGEHTIVIQATSRDGKVRTVTRNVEVESQ